LTLAIWVFDRLLEMIPGGLPDPVFSARTYPKTFVWRERYQEACGTTKRKLSDPPMIEGPEAAKRIFGPDFHEQKLFVDEGDFVGVKKGVDVEV
jgi:hypothetical protein